MTAPTFERTRAAQPESGPVNVQAKLTPDELLTEVRRLIETAPRDRRLWETTEFRTALAGVVVVLGARWLGVDPDALWNAALVIAPVLFGRQIEKGLKGSQG